MTNAVGSWPMNGVLNPHTASKLDSTGPLGVSCSRRATCPAPLVKTRSCERGEKAVTTGTIQCDVEQIGSIPCSALAVAMVASNEDSMSVNEQGSMAAGRLKTRRFLAFSV